MTLRLRGSHAVVVGGRMVEPGEDIDEAAAKPEELDRLKSSGRVREVGTKKPLAKKPEEDK